MRPTVSAIDGIKMSCCYCIRLYFVFLLISNGSSRLHFHLHHARARAGPVCSFHFYQHRGRKQQRAVSLSTAPSAPSREVIHVSTVCSLFTDTKQMDLVLGALFAKGPVAAAEPERAQRPEPLSAPIASTVNTTTDDNEIGGVSFSDDDLVGGPVTDSGLPFGMQIDTYAEDTIELLFRERDLFKAKAAEHKRAYEDLERRVYKKAVIDVDLPAEVMRRLN